MVGVIFFVVASMALLSWAWVSGIDYMGKYHPDYKGEDFLNWDEDDKHTIL